MSAASLRALVVCANPNAQSFSHALAAAAREGLERGGHDVTTIDLYADGYRGAMSADERAAYHGERPVLDEAVARHTELVQQSQILVFVYPTWWSGMPAILKGWLERTMVPGVGFVFHPRTHRVKPGLTHVRHIVGISTYGSSRAYVATINDNGRRALSRALRMSTGWRTRCHWLGLYGIDTSTADERAAFVERVKERTGRLT